MEGKERTGEVIGAAIEVHRLLGPGLPESAYELALAREPALRGYSVSRQQAVLLEYEGESLGDGFRLDLLLDDALVVEIKAVESLLPVHEAQLLTCLPAFVRKTIWPAGQFQSKASEGRHTAHEERILNHRFSPCSPCLRALRVERGQKNHALDDRQL
jgi:GxxExxY protein